MTLSPSLGVPKVSSSNWVARAGASGRCLHDGQGGVDPGLGLAGSRRCAPAQPGQLPASQVAPDGLGHRRPLLPFAAGLEVRRVTTFVQVAVATVDLEHPRRDPVQDVAIVTDDDQAAAEGGQPLLEPDDGAEVQMVGRFIQDEQVGLGDEDLGERHPLGLAARERLHRRIDERCHLQQVDDGRRLPTVADRGAHRA